MPKHHPYDAILFLYGSEGAPVGSSDLLDPTQVDHVIDVSEIVDVLRRDKKVQFKRPLDFAHRVDRKTAAVTQRGALRRG
jgi:hypothetical protein